jgi:hypothetical protein
MPETGKEDDKHEMMMEMQDMVWRAVSNVHDRIDYLSSAMSEYCYEHSKGHIPAIKSPSQMQKVLKVLDMDGDYVVRIPEVSIASVKNTVTAEINFKKE